MSIFEARCGLREAKTKGNKILSSLTGYIFRFVTLSSCGVLMAVSVLQFNCLFFVLVCSVSFGVNCMQACPKFLES